MDNGSVLIRLLALALGFCLWYYAGFVGFKTVFARLAQPAVSTKRILLPISKNVLESNRHAYHGKEEAAPFEIGFHRLALEAHRSFVQMPLIGSNTFTHIVRPRSQRGGILPLGDNSPNGEWEFGRIQYVEPNVYQNSLGILAHRRGFVGSPVLNFEPLAISSFLQVGIAAHLLCGVGHFFGLISNSATREERYEDQPPVGLFYGPLDGCVPIWRVIVGFSGLCAGYIAIFKIGHPGWGLGLLLLLGGGGTFVWLTGHRPCEENQINGGRNNPSHRPKIVTQKTLDNHVFLYYDNCIMANVLSTDKQIGVISALAEGSSIRSIERMTGVHRDTIMRLGVRVGEGCKRLMDAKMRDLPCTRLELDEIWGFVGKKDRNVRLDETAPVGSVWTFCAIDADTKLVPAFKVGDRGIATARAFVSDVASRMRNRVQISTDGLRAYVEAIESAFGSEVDFAQIVKTYGHEEVTDNRRYSAPEFVSSEKKVITGNPDERLISTSYVERLNATTRLHMRRLTRLTLAFSKKRENFEAAVALHFAYYNFVKRHNTLRCTPAMAAGIERNFWSVGDLLEVAA